MKKTRRCLTCMLGTTVIFALIAPHVVQAKTMHCNAGQVGCLISAINEANSNGQPANTIRLEPGVYVLTTVDNDTNGLNGLPSVTSTLTISGGDIGTTFITRPNTSPAFRLLHVGITGHLTLQGLRLSGGASSVFGALYNMGELTIRHSVVADNASTGLANSGGTSGIIESVFLNNSALTAGPGAIVSSGHLSISNSSIVNNRGDGAGGLIVAGGDVEISGTEFANNVGNFNAGGLWAFGGSSVFMTQTTFRGNLAEGVGGIRVGDFNTPATVVVKDSAFLDNISNHAGGAAIGNFIGTVEVTNTTFARNVQFPLGASCVSGIAVYNVSSGSMTIGSSTFAGNRTATPCNFVGVIFSGPNATTILQNTILTHDPQPSSLIQDCDGVITSLGNNLIGNPAFCDIGLQPTDLVGDAGLGAFIDSFAPGNGHFRLLPTSRAIDNGNDAACPAKDQIGQSRLHQCDIGSIEFHNDHER